ncbi:MAG: dihydrodipicolinate synthase family protein [Synergistaceae bacterium]|jgi:4-hydroxy-2-oxoglutarate aldolase|nr:dihydrodipicolinate synthase family protein [Synergistaceae bacterium]
MELKGIFAPIPTPFQTGGTIAWDALDENLEKWLSSPLHGLVVGGSNGEFPFLSFAERVDLTARVVSRTKGRIPVITGVHCPSLSETLELCRAVSDAGTDAVLALPPHYYKGQNTVETLRSYFWKLADSSPVPVVLYNMPANTGFNLTPECVREVSAHPSIIGIKDTSGDIVQIAMLCSEARQGFSVFVGSGGFFLAGLAVGCTGGTLAISNILPAACNRLMNLFLAGKIEEAREIQHRLLRLNHAVTKGYGIAGLKAAVDAIGLYGGPCRLPLLELDPLARQTVIQLLTETKYLDKEAWR